MGVIYNGNAVIPAPFIEVARRTTRSGAGQLQRKSFVITVKGTLSVTQGSPRSDGSFWNGSGYPPPELIASNSRLSVAAAKQKALIDLFSVSGRVFEVIGCDGASVLQCNPIVNDIRVPDGPWFDTAKYEIELETDFLVLGGVEFRNTDTTWPEESWAMETDNATLRTYRLSHTVSSQQLDHYNPDGTVTSGWILAQAIVLPHLSVGCPIGNTDIPNTVGMAPQNYSRGVTVDESAGKYTVTETWILVPHGTYTEEFNVQGRITVAPESSTRVTVEGTIQGYSPSLLQSSAELIGQTKLNNALAYWQQIEPVLLTRAQNYTGLILNPTPISKTFGANALTGAITYSYEFDDRPPPLIVGALSEVISAEVTHPNDVFASLTILGRAAGPLYQPLGTISGKTLSVNVEAVMPRSTYYNQGVGIAPPNTNAAMAYLYNTIIGPNIPFAISRDVENWTPKTGRYTRQVVWTYL